MKDKGTFRQIQKEEEIVVAWLPVERLGTFGMSLNKRLHRSRAVATHASFGPTRGGAFPCFNKRLWNNRIVLNIAEARDVLSVA